MTPILILPPILNETSGLTLVRGVYYAHYVTEDAQGKRTRRMTSLGTPFLAVAVPARDKWHAGRLAEGAVIGATRGSGRRGPDKTPRVRASGVRYKKKGQNP